jgi:hypothetical protein
MEYLITAIITAFFVILYIINKPKNREGFSHKLCEEEYKARLRALADSFSLPKRSTEKDYAVKKLKRRIYFVIFKSKLHQKRKKGIYLSSFINLCEENKSVLKALFKKDFSKLNDMPSIKAKARIEHIARAVLELNGFLLIDEKISLAFNVFNQKSTISYDEIKNFDLMVYFLLLEKLYYLAKRVQTLIKLENYAIKVVKNQKKHINDKLYKSVEKNNVFLHFASTARGEECRDASLVFFDVLQNLTYTSATIFDDIKLVENIDFTKFYSPLNIFENYVVFAESNIYQKSNFLTEFSSQATALNLDEFAYSNALQKYVDREETRYTTSLHFDLGVNKYRIIAFRSNLKSLRRALTSPFAMDLFFGNKYGNSILKKSVLKNTYAPKQKILSANISLSVKNNKLMLNPNLPKNFNSVQIDFVENGVKHKIFIEKSETRELYCNGTKYDGIPCIKLGDKPLDIHLKVPPKVF